MGPEPIGGTVEIEEMSVEFSALVDGGSESERVNFAKTLTEEKLAREGLDAIPESFEIRDLGHRIEGSVLVE